MAIKIILIKRQIQIGAKDKNSSMHDQMNYAIIIICLSYLNNYNLMRMIGESIKDLFYEAPFTLVS